MPFSILSHYDRKLSLHDVLYILMIKILNFYILVCSYNLSAYAINNLLMYITFRISNKYDTEDLNVDDFNKLVQIVINKGGPKILLELLLKHSNLDLYINDYAPIKDKDYDSILHLVI